MTYAVTHVGQWLREGGIIRALYWHTHVHVSSLNASPVPLWSPQKHLSSPTCVSPSLPPLGSFWLLLLAVNPHISSLLVSVSWRWKPHCLSASLCVWGNCWWLHIPPPSYFYDYYSFIPPLQCFWWPLFHTLPFMLMSVCNCDFINSDLWSGHNEHIQYFIKPHCINWDCPLRYCNEDLN